MCADAQNLQNKKRILIQTGKGLYFVFTAILSGAAQRA
jgi:hypothetical protein